MLRTFIGLARCAVLIAAAVPAIGILATLSEQPGPAPANAGLPASSAAVSLAGAERAESALRVDPTRQIAATPQPTRQALGDVVLLAERKTLRERKMFDQRTFMGDRPQDWYAAWRKRWRPAEERAKFGQRADQAGQSTTTRALLKPITKFKLTGPYARLVNDILRAKPKTRFVGGYIDQNGKYIMSSFYRQAAHTQPLGAYNLMWVTTTISNSTNFYVFKTTNQVHSRNFINSYFERDPVYQPSFYRHGAAGHRVTHGGLDVSKLRQKVRNLEQYYGRGDRALGWHARMRETTLETVQPKIHRRIPNVVYFRDRGWGTYTREYYRPPVPNIYRDVNWRLISQPVVHATPLTAP